MMVATMQDRLALAIKRLSLLPGGVKVRIEKDRGGDWLVELSAMCHNAELVGSCGGRRKSLEEATQRAFESLQQAYCAQAAEAERMAAAVGDLFWLAEVAE